MWWWCEAVWMRDIQKTDNDEELDVHTRLKIAEEKCCREEFVVL